MKRRVSITTVYKVRPLAFMREFPGILPTAIRGKISVWGSRRRHWNWNMAAGLGTMAAITVAGWTATALVLSHFLR
jgi:hypothetical protein